jgi:hypothetical protein
MKALTIVLDDETYHELELNAGSSAPAAVGLVAAQMIAYAIETDELPAGSAV